MAHLPLIANVPEAYLTYRDMHCRPCGSGTHASMVMHVSCFSPCVSTDNFDLGGVTQCSVVSYSDVMVLVVYLRELHA